MQAKKGAGYKYQAIEHVQAYASAETNSKALALLITQRLQKEPGPSLARGVRRYCAPWQSRNGTTPS